jgi:hypothetical protein
VTGAVLFGLPLLAWLVHALVIPLDVLAVKLGLDPLIDRVFPGFME